MIHAEYQQKYPQWFVYQQWYTNITYYFPIYFETKYTSLGQFVCLCFHSKLLPETDFARVQRSQKKVVSKLRVYVKKKKKNPKCPSFVIVFQCLSEGQQPGNPAKSSWPADWWHLCVLWGKVYYDSGTSLIKENGAAFPSGGSVSWLCQW